MRRGFRGGFTLVELSLSLIFISLLSLAVVFLIQNLTSSYRRGLILNQVNTVGMDLIDDFRISIQNANSEPITKMCNRMYGYSDDQNSNTQKCINDNARSFTSVTKYGTVTIKNNGKTETLSNIPIYGAFCTGTYTYIWNTGYFESPGDNFGTGAGIIDQRSVNPNTPAVLGTGTFTNFNQERKDFRLLKVYDSTRSVCVNAMKTQSGGESKYIRYEDYKDANISNKFIIDKNMFESYEAESEGKVTELLRKEGEYSDLVLYELYIAKPALSVTRKNSFYAASFILGTRRGINVRATGNNCRAPNDNYSDIEYCAINKFNFAVMAGGN